MKDREALLHQALSTPRRDLSPNFTARVVTELKHHPKPDHTNHKRNIPIMKKRHSMAIIIAITFITSIGGGAYAASYHPSLFSLLYAPANHKSDGSTIQPSDMQAIYTLYITELRQDNKQARAHFESHITAELGNKLSKISGYDPIVCSQNTPVSVSFENVDRSGSMTAINHFATGKVNVQLTYDSGLGIFTDITCPASNTASMIEKMQGYYQAYITDLQNNRQDAATAFLKHASPSLRTTIKQTEGYDPIICAQNIPAMVTFSDITRSSMVATNAFVGGVVKVKIEFDPSTSTFTAITCLNQ